MMTDSQVRSYILAGGILAAMLGASLYMRSITQNESLNMEGRQCRGAGVVVKYRPPRQEGETPYTRENFDAIEPLFVESGNLCVFQKIIAKASVVPATADEMTSARIMLFFISKRKEAFITNNGGVISMAREEKYLVKKDLVEIMIRQIEELANDKTGMDED